MRDSVKVHCHGPARAEAVGPDERGREAVAVESECRYGVFDRRVHFGCSDESWVFGVAGWEICADARLGVAGVGRDGFDAPDDRSNRAVRRARCFLVYADIAAAVLLVDDAERGGRASVHEGGFGVGCGEECSVVPKGDVADGELACACCGSLAVVGVFADTKEVVEGNNGHVPDGLGLGALGVLAVDVDEAGEGEWYREAWLWWRVLSFVALQLLADGLRIACFRRSQRAEFSVQEELRADGA